MVHVFREETLFGINQQLAVSFPLPRVHHISRRFKEEYESRTPSDTAIVISQAQNHFLPRREQDHLPKIVHLRAMQTQQVKDKFNFDLHICDPDTSYDEIFHEINHRLLWVERFVANVCTDLNNVSVSLLVDFPKDIVHAVQVLKAMHGIRFCAFAGKAELVFDSMSSGREESNTLGTWSSSTRMWSFDYGTIGVCESAAGLAGIYDD